ncbi:hypothetical protein PAMA_005349 [Pampus argenteus]
MESDEGPQALCDLCLAQVCRSLDVLCSKRPDGSLCLSWAPLFPQEMADQLLHKMATKGILNDMTVGIFRNCKELRLRRASIRCCPVSAEAFRLALCLHRLQELDASWVSGDITGANIVSGLASNVECRSSLQRLLFVLNQLHALRHMDFSDDHFILDDSDGSNGDETVRQLLEGSPQVLPSLVSLDVSGRKKITEAAVGAFVEARSGLIFLGLVATGVSSCNVLSSQKNLKVTGEANENQVCEALRRYRGRECFIREALVHLYNLTTDTDKPRPDMLKLVVSAMQSHPASLHVQLVATACVFNLTTQNMAEAMPVSLLSSAVAQLLYAMKTFPNHQQVQKNCLLALCSDYILQDVPFDKYLAATLVINWLSSHEDPTLQRMAVAVISILVAKLSTEETAQLGKDAFIMKQLLAIVQQKAMVGVVDSTLKFALSALWNLTDEMPTAAHSFIECQGLELYEEVLESYYTESSVQQKVLGLLNNIAEVEELQTDLMEEDLLEHIFSLMQDSQVEVGVRYFAGGILAQLTSRPEAWTLDDELRTTILKQLVSSHYSSMLEQEGVTELLKALSAHPDTHSDVKGLSDSILSMLEHHQNQSEPFNNQTGHQSS